MSSSWRVPDRILMDPEGFSGEKKQKKKEKIGKMAEKKCCPFPMCRLGNSSVPQEGCGQLERQRNHAGGPERLRTQHCVVRGLSSVERDCKGGAIAGFHSSGSGELLSNFQFSLYS